MLIIQIRPLIEQETELKILLGLIAFFAIGAIFTLGVTLIKRQQKINKVKIQRQFEQQIESYVLAFIFEKPLQTMLKIQIQKISYLRN